MVKCTTPAELGVHFSLVIGYPFHVPEIEVDSETWTGLRVVADRTRPGSPGLYALVQESEWNSKSKELTVWRGPDRADEQVPRERLYPVDCRSVVVDPEGFYDCLPDLDLLKEEVVPLAEEIMAEEADRRAAEVYSDYMSNEPAREAFGDDVWIMASFGDATAVNGETAPAPRDAKPPRGWVQSEGFGGHIYDGGEEEVDKEWLAEVIAGRLTVKLLRPIYPVTVHEVLDLEYPNRQYLLWSSSSGETEIWVSKKAMKAYEKSQEEALTLTREERERRRREELALRRTQEAASRLRLDEEARERLRRGGYPLRQDWSPRGRFPGERT
jgi:hypothetical protein